MSRTPAVLCLPRSLLAGIFAVFACMSALPAAPYTWYPRAIILSDTTVELTWEDWGPYPADYWQIYRDGMLYATATTPSYVDTTLTPGENHTYYIQSSSTQTSAVPSRSLTITAKTEDNSFVLDGAIDFSSYTWLFPTGCDCTHLPSLPLYAAVRGRTLYVATASPGAPNGATTDRFLFISDVVDQSAATPAPWAKSGWIRVPAGKPYIGAESGNSYVGWFNAPASAQVVRSSGPNGRIEGTIDLIETFGYIPERLYMAVAAYDTSDGGWLIWHNPRNDQPRDNIIEPDEFMVLNTAGLRDEDADGILDLTDPAKHLKLTIVQNPDRSMTISFPTVPYRTYVLEHMLKLGEPYENIGWFPSKDGFSGSHTDYSTADYYPQVRSFYTVTVKEWQ